MSPSKTFKLFADCVPVRGAVRSAIYDLTRRRIITFASSAYDEILALDGSLAQGEPGEPESPSARRAASLIRFLLDHELGAWVTAPERFSALPASGESAGLVQNAIVDVRHVRHDFSALLEELDALGCEFVQLRAYSDLLSIAELQAIAEHARHKAIRSLEVLIPFSARYPDPDLLELMTRQRIIGRCIVHGAPQERTLLTASTQSAASLDQRAVHFIAERLEGAWQCGQISPRNLAPPSAAGFDELRRRNGCLHGKIAVDEAGRIKNCPSLPTSHGQAGRVPLRLALVSARAAGLGTICKDQIEVCKDCELRYACTDCRAHTARPGDVYSKPAQCSYDPYTGQWRSGVAAQGAAP